MSSRFPECTAEEKSWCNTSTEIIRLSYRWTIDHFSWYGEDEELTSSTFSPKNDETMKWCLIFRNNPEQNTYDISLKLVSNYESSVKVKYEFCILDVIGEKRSLFINGPCNISKGDTTESFIFTSDFLNFWGIDFDGHLTIGCDMWIKNKFETYSNEMCLKKVKVPEFRLSEHIGTLFNSEKFSDVILSVNDQSNAIRKEFYAHKAILAANSLVFSAVFESDMKEKEQNIIEIEDADPIVVEDMLRFIYTNHLFTLDETVNDLLAIADKYDLERLKLICEDKLCCRLITETACDILALGDIYNAKQLKECAIDFISSRLNSVMKTAGWVKMAGKYPHLVDLFSE